MRKARKTAKTTVILRKMYVILYHVSAFVDVIYPTFGTPYHTFPFYCLLMSKTAGWVANSVDPDHKPRSAASILVYTVCSGMFVRIRIEKNMIFRH